MKLAERYTIKNEHKNGNIYAIITETKDGKYFVATDCGENGDKCGEWKVFDTYEEACRCLRSIGYSMLMKVIEVDESTGEGVKAQSEIDDEAPIKVFSSYEEYKRYFDKLPIRRVPMLIHKGNVLTVDVAIKADDLDTAIRRALAIYAEYPAITDAIKAIREEVDRECKCHSKGLIKWYYIKSDTRGYTRYRIMLDVAVEEPEEAQNSSDDVHETNDEACKIAGVRYECSRSIRDGKECDTYTAVYPTETKVRTADGTTAKAMVVEFCSNCETEIEMRWDVKTQGYKAYCPVCGERLMLCDECQHRGEDGKLLDDCDFDGRDDTCRFNPKVVNGGNPQKSKRGYCPVLGDWMMLNDGCYQIMTDGTRTYDCEYEIEKGTCNLFYRNNTPKGGDA